MCKFVFAEDTGLTFNNLTSLVQKEHWFASSFPLSPAKLFCTKYQVFCGKLLSVVPQLHLNKQLSFSVPMFSAR